MTNKSNLRSIFQLLNNENTPTEERFLMDLKKSIELEDNKNKRLPSKTYKPSSMNCIRNMYYQVIGAEQDENNVNYCLVGICNSGSDIHIRTQQAIEAMKDNGMNCEYIDVATYIQEHNLDYLEIKEKSGMETKLFHKDLNMSFMTDGIIKYKNEYYILEIKTETVHKWSSRLGVDEKHRAQAVCYSIAFNIPDVIFLYISRDNLDIKAFKYSPTQEDKENLLNKIKNCDEYVINKIVPPKTENTKYCTYCNYKNLCNKEM